MTCYPNAFVNMAITSALSHQASGNTAGGPSCLSSMWMTLAFNTWTNAMLSIYSLPSKPITPSPLTRLEPNLWELVSCGITTCAHAASQCRVKSTYSYSNITIQTQNNQHAPHGHLPITYRKTEQLSPEPNTKPVLLSNNIKQIQGIIGSLLYYARAADNKLLATLSTLSTQQMQAIAATACASTNSWTTWPDWMTKLKDIN